MTEQGSMTPWLQPACKPAPGQPHPRHASSDILAATCANPPQRRTTLLDVLAALDVHALRILAGHLEADKSFPSARKACKALRDACDTGARHVRVNLDPRQHPEVIRGGPDVPPALLTKWPSCTSLDLNLDMGWEVEAAEEQLCPLRLVTCLFQGLPLAQRMQIRELKLCTMGWEGPLINVSRLMVLLGPLLPGLEHIDLARCDMSGWQLRQGESCKEWPAALAAAFPLLRSVTVFPCRKQLDNLATHMWNSLQKLVLRIPFSSMHANPEIWAALPRLVQLKTLIIGRLLIYTQRPSRYYYSRREGIIAPSEQLVVQLFDSLPPALETLHLRDFELDTSDKAVGRMCGTRLELGLQDGRVQVVRVGWEVQHKELCQIIWLLRQSKLVEGSSGRLQLLQLAGLRQSRDPVLGDGHDYTWRYLEQQCDRFELGRLHISSDASAEAMATLVQIYRPELVACAGCVVRLRGRGPPPSWAHVLPRWSQGVGGAWAEEEPDMDLSRPPPAFEWGRPAQGAAEAVAGGGLQLVTAHVTDVEAAIERPVRNGIAQAVAAAAAAAAAAVASGAGKDIGRGPGVERDHSTGGIVLEGGQGYWSKVLLVTGPYLTTEVVTDTWVKVLCQRAESLRAHAESPSETQSGLPYKMHDCSSGMTDMERCVRLSLPQQQPRAVAAGGNAGGASGAGAAPAAGAAGRGVALLLQMRPGHTPRWVQQVVQEVCAPCNAAAAGQGGVPGLQALKLRGSSIEEVLHDAYMSPVLQALWDGSEGSGLGERQRLEKLFELWGAVTRIATITAIPARWA